MKKIYFFLALLLGVNLSNAQIYNATVETGSRYNPLNDSIATFDDIVLNVGSPNASANVVITQIQAGIRRLANAPAVDVALYLGRMNSFKFPSIPDSIFQTSLAANGASAVTTLLTATNASGWALNMDTIVGNNSRRGFYLGVRFRGSNATSNSNGWRIVDAPTIGFADSTFGLINILKNTYQGPYNLTYPTKGYFYTIVTGTVNIVTPVKLSFFKASYLGENASLFWNVESEVNFKEYIIESSYDGMRYKKVGVVEARNSKSYEFNLGILNRGKNYFRLKMVDKDGKFEYSSVEVLESKSIMSKLSILTNPVFDNLNFNWSAEGTYRFQIIGINGKQFKIGAVLNGMNSINLSNFKQGTYVLDIINEKGGVVEARKVIKL